MSTADDDNGQVLPAGNWGPFKPWRAATAIFALVKGNAQHVAIALARKTPTSGSVFVTHKELAVITGRNKNAIPTALDECVEAGLLTRRRVMGGFTYTWGRVTYYPTEVANVGRNGQIPCSVADSNSDDAARRILVPTYLAKLNLKYGIRPDSPEAQKRIGLTEQQRENVVANIVYGAGALNITVESMTDRALTKWFAVDGMNGGDFLKRNKHPLARFADDVGLLVCNLISFEEHKRKHSVSEELPINPSERVENHASLRPDVRKNNIQGANNLLAAIGVQRPIQRVEYKLAANG